MSAAALRVFAGGCATGQTARENTLERAGFHSVTATTPTQISLLNQLPANSISRVRKDGSVWFVFPNQATSSAMVGTAANLREYQILTRSQHMQPMGVSTVSISSWSSFGGPRWGWRTTTSRRPPGSW